MNSDINTKQMGDAGEALVVSELTLAGVPAVKMPDNWPSYDVIAEPKGAEHPQRISVKSRTFKRGGDGSVEYHINDKFDWLAVVILPGGGKDERQIFIFPKTISNDRFHQPKLEAKYHNYKSCRLDKMEEILLEFKDNFVLSPTGNAKSS